MKKFTIIATGVMVCVLVWGVICLKNTKHKIMISAHRGDH